MSPDISSKAQSADESTPATAVAIPATGTSTFAATATVTTNVAAPTAKAVPSPTQETASQETASKAEVKKDESKSKDKSDTPTAPKRRRRGRQKVRNVVTIPGTDLVEIYCIHGCGCKYETKVFSADRAAWHKALRCINAHESQRCPRNKNSTRCFKKKMTPKSEEIGSKRKSDFGYPFSKKADLMTGNFGNTVPMNQPIAVHPAQMNFAQPQLHPQIPQMSQVPQNRGELQSAPQAPQHSHLAPQQQQMQPQMHTAPYNTMNTSNQVYGMMAGQQSHAVPNSMQQAPFQQGGPGPSQQCSQFCRYRRAVAELMLENSRLKNDNARLKDLLNSVSHLQQQPALGPNMPQVAYRQVMHQPAPQQQLYAMQ